MPESLFDDEPSAAEFQEESKDLIAFFEGLEFVLMGRYGLNAGEWQRHFAIFKGSLQRFVTGAVERIEIQEHMIKDLHLHIESIEPAGNG